MLAHIKKRGRQLLYSGYNACGDPTDGAGIRATQDGTAPTTPYFAIVDLVGRDFILTEDEKLYITSYGPKQHTEWSAEELYLAAKQRWFGFHLVDALQGELF